MFDIGIAHAAGEATGGTQAGIMQMVPLVLIFAVFYFLLIRPQQKRAKEQQEMIKALKKGDAVVTSGGLHGTITGLTDTVVTLEIADNVRVKISRQHILGTAATVGAKKDDNCKPSGG